MEPLIIISLSDESVIIRDFSTGMILSSQSGDSRANCSVVERAGNVYNSK
jgi:hypothetical protein